MKLFEELTQLHGVSGYETAVADYIKEKLAPLADDITTDPNGSIIAYFKGTGEHKKRIELAAHTDEIGFQVIKIEEDGRIMFKELGCCWTFTTYQSRVRFRNGVVGVVASRIPPEKLSAGGYKRYTDCYIDIGLHSKEEVLKYVDVGDVACYEGPYTELAPGYITAKAIDDRVGCYMLLAAIMNVKKPKNDVTPCHDRPGDLEGSNALDHGVAIKISDTGSISDEGLVNKSIALCKEHNVPYQKDVIYVGGTDAGAMTLVGGGIKTIGFSVVTRYTHGPNAIVSQKDIEATVKMLELFMNADFE